MKRRRRGSVSEAGSRQNMRQSLADAIPGFSLDPTRRPASLERPAVCSACPGRPGIWLGSAADDGKRVATVSPGYSSRNPAPSFSPAPEEATLPRPASQPLGSSGRSPPPVARMNIGSSRFGYAPTTRHDRASVRRRGEFTTGWRVVHKLGVGGVLWCDGSGLDDTGVVILSPTLRLRWPSPRRGRRWRSRMRGRAAGWSSPVSTSSLTDGPPHPPFGHLPPRSGEGVLLTEHGIGASCAPLPGPSPHPTCARTFRSKLRYPPHQGEGEARTEAAVSLPLMGRVVELGEAKPNLAELGWGEAAGVEQWIPAVAGMTMVDGMGAGAD